MKSPLMVLAADLSARENRKVRPRYDEPTLRHAIAAHPDDIEFVMPGTLCLLREAGYETHYLNTSTGFLRQPVNETDAAWESPAP